MSSKRIVQICLIVVVLLVSLAAAPEAQASSWCGSTYVVQRGDWLAKIARNCGVTLSQLYAANSWTRYYYYIYPGQVLTIPGGGWEPGGGPGGSYVCGPNWDDWGAFWTVCRGDTLGIIARYYGVSWRYLQQVNGIANANLIYPGQVIRP
jgi:LysM repeat protein